MVVNSLESKSLAATLADAMPSQRKRLLVTYLQELIAKTSGANDLPPIDAGLFGYIGLDSLKAVEVQAHLEEALGLSLAATIAFEQPTIRALADYLLSELESHGCWDPNRGPAVLSGTTGAEL